MKNIIIVHGCPSSEDSAIDFNDPKHHAHHWIPWVRSRLEEQGIEVAVPMMPEPWAPVYKAFREEFEKLTVNEDTILIGHSCGCAFLVRWLGDSKQKINKLILVAPWKVASVGNETKEAFYDYPIDQTIRDRVNQIVMFTSNDEDPRGKDSLKMYYEGFGGKIIELQDQGHYIVEHMGTEEFPELLEVI